MAVLGKTVGSNRRSHMSEVETSQADLDLRALEDFLVGNPGPGTPGGAS